MSRPPAVALIIFDGWGVRHAREANAIALAKTPVMDRLRQSQPHTELNASGESVGLPPGVMGNSEVGHLTIGAGRVVCQDVVRISREIERSAFSSNPALLEAIRNSRGRKLHVWGLLSDASVHSHIDHLFALLELAAKNGAGELAVHAVLDGRDTPPRSALPFIERLEAKLAELGRGRIATVSGRYFAMDRDGRWERTERAWRAMAEGEGARAGSAREAVEHSYAAGAGDEFVAPTVVAAPIKLEEGDQVACFNFRADRARQLTAALALEDFRGFPRPRRPKAGYVCMTEYDKSFKLPTVFGPQEVRNTLAEVFAREKVRNLRLAETEKYAHVTYFLNGGVEKPFPMEERALIPSPKVATYDLEPAMRAREIAARAAKELALGRFDVLVINFANPDMVGHSGDLVATVKAIEASDQALGAVIDALAWRRGVALVTSDHGNAEFMADPETGQPHTAHTTNPVPFILCDPSFRGRLRDGGALYDIAPTLLRILEIEPPPEMTGRDLREPA